MMTWINALFWWLIRGEKHDMEFHKVQYIGLHGASKNNDGGGYGNSALNLVLKALRVYHR